MKSLFIAAVLFLSVNSFADTESCTQVIQNMADVTNSYTTALNTCRQFPRGSVMYKKGESIARGAEALYPQLLSLCFQQCDSETSSVFCNDNPINGACQ